MKSANVYKPCPTPQGVVIVAVPQLFPTPPELADRAEDRRGDSGPANNRGEDLKGSMRLFRFAETLPAIN
jgi:hypothetical protein